MPGFPVGFAFFQLRGETLPQWLRRMGALCVTSDPAPPGEEGHPEIPGYRVAAVHLYRGTTLDSVFRFYLPADSTETFPEFRAGQAVESIRKRLGSPVHAPVRVWCVDKRGKIKPVLDQRAGESAARLQPKAWWDIFG